MTSKLIKDNDEEWMSEETECRLGFADHWASKQLSMAVVGIHLYARMARGEDPGILNSILGEAGNLEIVFVGVEDEALLGTETEMVMDKELDGDCFSPQSENLGGNEITKGGMQSNNLLWNGSVVASRRNYRKWVELEIRKDNRQRFIFDPEEAHDRMARPDWFAATGTLYGGGYSKYGMQLCFSQSETTMGGVCNPRCCVLGKGLQLIR